MWKWKPGKAKPANAGQVQRIPPVLWEQVCSASLGGGRGELATAFRHRDRAQNHLSLLNCRAAATVQEKNIPLLPVIPGYHSDISCTARKSLLACASVFPLFPYIQFSVLRRQNSRESCLIYIFIACLCR